MGSGMSGMAGMAGMGGMQARHLRLLGTGGSCRRGYRRSSWRPEPT